MFSNRYILVCIRDWIVTCNINIFNKCCKIFRKYITYTIFRTRVKDINYKSVKALSAFISTRRHVICFYSPYFYFMGIARNGPLPFWSHEESKVLPVTGFSMSSLLDVPEGGFSVSANFSCTNVDFNIVTYTNVFCIYIHIKYKYTLLTVTNIQFID